MLKTVPSSTINLTALEEPPYFVLKLMRIRVSNKSDVGSDYLFFCLTKNKCLKKYLTVKKNKLLYLYSNCNSIAGGNYSGTQAKTGNRKRHAPLQSKQTVQKSFYAAKAIVQQLDDMKDYYFAEETDKEWVADGRNKL